jgi:tRNA dimethylallyltransferase
MVVVQTSWFHKHQYCLVLLFAYRMFGLEGCGRRFVRGFSTASQFHIHKRRSQGILCCVGRNLSLSSSSAEESFTDKMSTAINDTSPRKLPLVVILAGPTAVGKSDVAASLCADGKGIVVSADSVQAYKGVQIGANKPTDAERQATPHLLLDVADASMTYNAAEWRRDAVDCLYSLTGQADKVRDRTDDITNHELDPHAYTRWIQIQESIQAAIMQQKSRQPNDMDNNDNNNQHSVLPVVVGGTMMYIQWLVQGRPDALRPTPLALQEAAQSLQDCHGDWEKAVSIVTAYGEPFGQQVAKLSGRDWFRLRRILEVALTVKEAQKDNKNSNNLVLDNLYSGQRDDPLDSLGFDVRCFFLCPTDRMVHAKVIDERCEQMIVQGLIEETTDLACTGQLPDMATKAIGYRQVLEYLEARDVSDNDTAAFLSFVKDFSTATRNYSAKQMKWFRKEHDFVFVPVALDKPKPDRVKRSAAEIHRWLALSRDDFESERSQSTGVHVTTRQSNEAQGKHMKVYQYSRTILLDDSPALEDAVHRANACRQRYQSKSRKLLG